MMQILWIRNTGLNADSFTVCLNADKFPAYIIDFRFADRFTVPVPVCISFSTQ